jgi:predicted phosphodiesterase
MHKKHMVLPDAHFYPGDDFERAEMAGAFALKHKPDTVVCLGDWADMPSLSSYDVGKKSFEGRRYSEDVQASRDALAAFDKPINEYNLRQAKNRKVQYKPKKVMLGGNHDEGRILRVIEMDPRMEGTIDLDDLGFEEYGWDYQPYLLSKEIDGILYNHYFISGVMGNSISGENPAKTIIKKNMHSSTAGHSHLKDEANVATPLGKMVYGLVAGCYFEHSMVYARAVEHLWWRGLHLKHDVKDGEYDLESWSMDRLRREL